MPLQGVPVDNVGKGRWGNIQILPQGWWATSPLPTPVWLRNAVWFVLTLLVILLHWFFLEDVILFKNLTSTSKVQEIS